MYVNQCLLNLFWVTNPSENQLKAMDFLSGKMHRPAYTYTHTLYMHTNHRYFCMQTQGFTNPLKLIHSIQIKQRKKIQIFGMMRLKKKDQWTCFVFCLLVCFLLFFSESKIELFCFTNQCSHVTPGALSNILWVLSSLAAICHKCGFLL